MIFARILAVVSAAFLVTAFALALLLPPELWLGQAIAMVDHDWLVNIQDAVRGVSEWSWRWLALPLLMRPVWFLPAGLGLVCAGIAVTLSTRRGPLRSRHRG